MSGIFISSYFPFRRIKIVKQVVEPNATKAVIDVIPSASIPCAMCADKRPPTFTVGLSARYGASTWPAHSLSALEERQL
jgi:hypothetical protein